jgi:hypothetical protein
VSGIKMIPVLNKSANNVVETKSMIKTMSVEIIKLHKILGHFRNTRLKTTDNASRIKVFGKLEACNSCAISKANQNKIKKVWTG